MTLPPGARLGPYEIVAPIGAGGMGEVYRARDTRLNRDVAVKVLPPAFTQDADRVRRFEQEARAAAALNHPNVMAVFDVGVDGDVPYVVSELLEGETLREALSRGALPQRRVTDLAAQIARGMAAAHQKGIVHRDLKPENIFVTTDGPREDPRLRPREAHRAGRGGGRRDAPAHLRGDDSRHGARHGRVHVAGAGARRTDRPPDRHLRVRRRVLRDAHGARVRSPATPRSRR